MKRLLMSMRNILIGLCLPMLVASAQPAHYPGFKPVADLPGFRSKFAAASEQISSVKGDFIQEKTLSALTEKITSRGALWFKRENKVRMDYTSPFAYQMIINGDRMSIRDEHKQTLVNTASNKLFQQINTIIIDCMQGTILDSKDFTTRVFESDSGYLLEMTPVAKAMKQFFSTIVIIIDKKSSSPDSIELREPGGDTTLITFTNKILNAPLPDEVFSF
jgi:outer membrane lipoprotein-sorting protein